MLSHQRRQEQRRPPISFLLLCLGTLFESATRHYYVELMLIDCPVCRLWRRDNLLRIEHEWRARIVWKSRATVSSAAGLIFLSDHDDELLFLFRAKTFHSPSMSQNRYDRMTRNLSIAVTFLPLLGFVFRVDSRPRPLCAASASLSWFGLWFFDQIHLCLS